MSRPRRSTIYFDPEIHKALRLRAAESDKSISDMVNEAVKLSLADLSCR
jgi:predicted HicB family RNase H-like nuclease